MSVGTDLLAKLKQRLGIVTGVVVDDVLGDPALYGYLSDARDALVRALAIAAPIVVQEEVTLTLSGSTYIVPGGTADPLRCLSLVSVTDEEPLTPSSQLNQDSGEYVWKNLRTLKLADFCEPSGGVKGTFVLQRAAIDAATTATTVGVPSTCYLAVVYGAAVLVLTQGESEDSTDAQRLLGLELANLERLYGEYDGQGGQVLRQALMMNLGALQGDTLY